MGPPRRRHLLRLAACLILPASLGVAPAGTARAASGQIVVAQSADVLSLNPMADNSVIGLNVFRNIFDTLTEVQADGSVEPRLALSWESSEDVATWTFRLRTDATFHNGDPVTSADVIWTYQTILDDPKSPFRAYLSNIRRLEAIGEDRVRITLDQPYAPFPRQLSLVMIQSKKVVEAMGVGASAERPIGSGPFRFVSWQKDAKVELEANPGYWGGAPRIQKLIFKPIPSDAGRTAALLTGEVNVVPVLAPTAVERLRSAGKIKIETVLSNRPVFLGFNTEGTVLADLKLRQAIDHAIDRRAIAGRLLRGMAEPSGQIAPPMLFGYNPEIAPTAYDPELARRLVGQSGYKGEEIIFQYPNNRWAFADQTAEAVAGYLQAVGIKVRLAGSEFAPFFALWQSHKLGGLFMGSTGTTTLDGDLLLRLFYETPKSFSYWRSDESLRLISAQRAERDPAKRKALIGRVLAMSQDEVAWAPLYIEVHAYGMSPDVVWTPRADGVLNFKDAVLSDQPR